MMGFFRRALVALAAVVALSAAPAFAQQSAWDNVGRVVVIGDLHGDYDKFLAMVRDAGLIDANGDWSGGAAHLVQLGDIPDRGDHSRRIIDHLMRLQPQAAKAGGHVHPLIGNHEAMNVEGDVRYVSPGEYAAFVDRGSARKRDAYYRRYQAALRKTPPASGLPAFDAAYRAQWDAEHPLGFVEHRFAWAPTGAYGKWVTNNSALVRINDTLYMHAGIGPLFPAADRDTLNEAVRAALRGRPSPAFPDITTNQQGPLWYRGLALNDEATEKANLEALLQRFGVARIVVGHTKRAPMVFPRFDGRLIVADIAVPAGGVDPRAYLVQENGALTAVHRGQRIPMQATTREGYCAYVAAVAALEPPQGQAARLNAACLAGLPPPTPTVVTADPSAP
jgi:hypothetical protein